MAKRILTAIVFVLFAPYVEAAQCNFLPDLTTGAKWSWQWVDSKICWYQGDENAPKESLRWDAPAQAATASAAEQKAAKPRERTAATESAAAPGQKIECSAEPKGAGPWTWRTIDAKRCWYRGPRDTPRAALYWPAEPRAEAPKPVERTAEPVETPQAAAPAAAALAFAAIEPAESDHADDVEIAAQAAGDENANAQPPEPWQLVNPANNGDVEFLAIGERVPVPFAIDHNVGTQYLTRMPMAFWPPPDRAPAN